MSDPVHYLDMYPSKYLRESDLKGQDVTLTIDTVSQEKVMRAGLKQPELKAVLGFKETDKLLIANKTNGTSIAKLHGVKVADWVGKKITVYPTTCRLGPDPKVPCIRVRGAK